MFIKENEKNFEYFQLIWYHCYGDYLSIFFSIHFLKDFISHNLNLIDFPLLTLLIPSCVHLLQLITVIRINILLLMGNEKVFIIKSSWLFGRCSG